MFQKDMFLLDAESISGILGWVSICCWVVVYSPQIYENYSLQSGEGLSVVFVVIWLLGDLFNLFGAIQAHLLETMILLALYYTLCDLILLFQIYYYRSKRPTDSPASPVSDEAAEEATPLLSAPREEKRKISTAWMLTRYTISVASVVAAGVFAWWISLHVKTDRPPTQPEDDSTQWMIQLMGWSSAILYLGARIPQIAKNIQTRCAGLSPALFLFAILGNGTYSLSICAASTGTRQYWVTNASWLAGSALTIFLDLIVLGQFFYYRSTDRGENPRTPL